MKIDLQVIDPKVCKKELTELCISTDIVYDDIISVTVSKDNIGILLDWMVKRDFNLEDVFECYPELKLFEVDELGPKYVRKPDCDFLPCNKKAIWRITWDSTESCDFNNSCTEHVGNLLLPDNKNTVKPIK